MCNTLTIMQTFQKRVLRVSKNEQIFHWSPFKSNDKSFYYIGHFYGHDLYTRQIAFWKLLYKRQPSFTFGPMLVTEHQHNTIYPQFEIQIIFTLVAFAAWCYIFAQQQKKISPTRVSLSYFLWCILLMYNLCIMFSQILHQKRIVSTKNIVWYHTAQNEGTKYATRVNNYPLNNVLLASTTATTRTETANGVHTIWKGF